LLLDRADIDLILLFISLVTIAQSKSSTNLFALLLFFFKEQRHHHLILARNSND
jgi:hypothetical protein